MTCAPGRCALRQGNLAKQTAKAIGIEAMASGQHAGKFNGIDILWLSAHIKH
jgi:hypothetical protein